MSKRTLYLVRHGQYDTSIKTRDGGNLTDLGREQAAITGDFLSQHPINAVYASTMIRAIETAYIIADIVQVEPVTETDLLREGVPIIPPRFAAHFFDLIERDPNFDHDHIHQDQKRADAAFDSFFTPPDSEDDIHEILVCHGNILRYLTCKALGVNVAVWANMNIYHCGVTTITVDEDGLLRLSNHNETAHFPADKITDV